MNPKQLKDTNNNFKYILIDIIKDNSFFDFSFYEPNEEVLGHYWVVSTFFAIGDDFERIVKTNLFKIKRNDISSKDSGGINDFFQNNDDFANELEGFYESGKLDTLLPMLRSVDNYLTDDEVFEVSFDAKYNSDNDFKNNLLEEDMCGVSLRDNKLIFTSSMYERKFILVPEGDKVVDYFIPSDKIELFPRLYQPQKYQEHGKTNDYIFIIMSFMNDPILTDAYNAMVRAIRKWNKKAIVERVDLIDGDFKITEKIIECINKADIIVADLTGERPNVYFELGYASAKEKKVIRTAKVGTNLHFDIKDLNTIFWNNVTELENALVKRLKTMFKSK